MLSKKKSISNSYLPISKLINTVSILVGLISYESIDAVVKNSRRYLTNEIINRNGIFKVRKKKHQNSHKPKKSLTSYYLLESICRSDDSNAPLKNIVIVHESSRESIYRTLHQIWLKKNTQKSRIKIWHKQNSNETYQRWSVVLCYHLWAACLGGDLLDFLEKTSIDRRGEWKSWGFSWFGISWIPISRLTISLYSYKRFAGYCIFVLSFFIEVRSAHTSTDSWP